MNALVSSLRIPDLWQQEAVAALRAGRDVVVHAPTGAGKTYVFELLYPSLKGQAVFTVPTRALANDKLAEWRAAGWDVGITTGDVSERPDARVVVATLETQRERLLRRDGPRLLVVDEYQMLADAERGAHYELALALAPPKTQLLLLSGSVGNPPDIVAWLRRLGRDAVLVCTDERPVPLEEVTLENLSFGIDDKIRGFWPRFVAKALQADLGPVLLFTPRRVAAELLARELAAALPGDDPLPLSPEQALLAGEQVAKLLRRRVAFHHSGLAYGLRAGLIEPLAKAGQLRAVIATTGLAAGVNFSLRSVLITDTRYAVRGLERHLQPEELLQMFGRAGRRGLDERGYVLVAPGRPRLADARPRQLKRAARTDWPTLVSVMAAEADKLLAAGCWLLADAPSVHQAQPKIGEGKEAAPSLVDSSNQQPATSNQRPATGNGQPAPPFAAAVRLCHSLFSPQTVPLGAERCLADGPRPCGLWVDAERARLARPLSVEIFNSLGQWQPAGEAVEVPLDELLIRDEPPRGGWRPALQSWRFFAGIGSGGGNVVKLRAPEEKGWRYGRELPLAVEISPPEVRLAKGLRPALEALGEEWRGRNYPVGGRLGRAVFVERVLPLVPALSGGGKLFALVQRGPLLAARVDFSHLLRPAFHDAAGRALFQPEERRNYPTCCQGCPELPVCENADRAATPALAWRQLGLVEPDGTPTRRGRVFRLFQHGEGLAVAAGLEDGAFAIEDLLYHLANLRAGPRFVAEGDNPHAGRLAARCQQVYGRAEHPGYLQSGVPPDYGDGAHEAVWTLLHEPSRRHTLLNETLRAGDLERALTEWRSLLRGIVSAPTDPVLEEWPRWRELRAAARRHLSGSPAGSVPVFPPLLPAQTRRYQHRLR